MMLRATGSIYNITIKRTYLNPLPTTITKGIWEEVVQANYLWLLTFPSNTRHSSELLEQLPALIPYFHAWNNPAAENPAGLAAVLTQVHQGKGFLFFLFFPSLLSMAPLF